MGCNIRVKNQKILVLDNRNIHVLVKIAPKIGHFRVVMNWFSLFTTILQTRISFLLHPISLVGNDIKYLYNKITIKLKRPNYTRCIFFITKQYESTLWAIDVQIWNVIVVIKLKEGNLFSSSLAIYYNRFDFYFIPHTFINVCRTLD